MSTRDLFCFEHMSYTSSPQYPSGSPVGMVDRCFETGSENNVVDEGPPPAPLALSTYSTPPLPPKYRTIKPRFSDGGLMPKPPDDTLEVKPRRHRRSGTRRNRQRQQQEKIGEPNPVQPEAEASMVSFTRPRSERFELPNHLKLP
ncbi:hypothetical protein DTO013E5_10065 [Penicillium roqueforti]|uniref:uncharacterized protein n=1 Tax=Penicillium rubens TaxID=1108849 RepID=UPI002A5A5F1E|nr:uncharacterized protein N7525_007314 [Penicillium rubens]KAI2734168.1 hypothetical protein DTO012A1_10188 [Penicillium roqueforti]KAI2735509.1 hypothetical protein DTO013F2_10116 [Penicillium roqueforti]KAI2765913.1 hypothetical protein DTO012A8_8869 [Penicillium roqueforti]KAI3061893.1 hypothetical protein CBS147339_9975 [Penicillium roqueforti]KAI3088841.1 hypothetical protein CBS147338_9887 [Penicillium roqueforti]